MIKEVLNKVTYCSLYSMIYKWNDYSIEAPLKPLIKTSYKERVNGIISGLGNSIISCICK